MNPSHLLKKPDFVQLQEPLQNCAHLTHKICENLRNAQPFNEVNGDPNKNHFVIKSLEEQINMLNTFYNSLESIVNDLPSITPLESSNQVSLTAYSAFINESNENSDKQELFNEASDAAHYANYMQAYSTFAHETMLQTFGAKASSLFDTEINIPFSSFKQEKLQKQFDKIFVACVADATKDGETRKTHRFISKPVESSVSHCIIELVLESKSFIKALILVNNGQIDYINLYSYHEKYAYVDNKRKVIDIFVRSKSEYYSNLTTFANNQFQMYLQKRKIGDFLTRTNQDIRLIFSIMLKCNQMIMQTCKICKKYLYDGMPPTIFVNRTPVHPECRGTREFTL
uniref:Mediator of RNA polymerase II transcription subunit 27 n=1 Tax=Panagrolaimus superbus TaxID=310955 RepID=A0A914Z698_9BILA